MSHRSANGIDIVSRDLNRFLFPWVEVGLLQEDNIVLTDFLEKGRVQELELGEAMYIPTHNTVITGVWFTTDVGVLFRNT